MVIQRHSKVYNNNDDIICNRHKSNYNEAYSKQFRYQNAAASISNKILQV